MSAGPSPWAIGEEALCTRISAGGDTAVTQKGAVPSNTWSRYVGRVGLHARILKSRAILSADSSLKATEIADVGVLSHPNAIMQLAREGDPKPPG